MIYSLFCGIFLEMMQHLFVSCQSPSINFIKLEQSPPSHIERDKIFIKRRVEKLNLHGNNLGNIDTLYFIDEAQQANSTKLLKKCEIVIESSKEHLLAIIINIKDRNNCVKLKAIRGRQMNTWFELNFNTPLIIEIDLEIPSTVIILLLVLLLISSGILSGLNIALMSVDPDELKLIIKCGNKKEQKYARDVFKLRTKKNILLTSIIIGNAALNSLSTIMTNRLIYGLPAIFISGLSIVIISEIIPQSISTRYALMYGAKTKYLSLFLIFITYPLSFPIGSFLNFLFHDKDVRVYNKERLKEIVRSTGDKALNPLEKDIIFAGLDLNSKTVKDIMLPLSNCYMLEESDRLDEEKLLRIKKEGYRRIPIYRRIRENIVGVIHSTDLAFLDPKEGVPVTNVLKVNERKLVVVSIETKINVLLKKFQNGVSHIAMVYDDENCEPENSIAHGIVTIQDVIRVIFHGDLPQENKFNDKNIEELSLPKKSVYKSRGKGCLGQKPEFILLTSRLTLYIAKYLKYTIDSFLYSDITIEELTELINRHGNIISFDTKQCGSEIYQKGFPSDYLVLVLDGTVCLKVGLETLTFNQGPYHYYGEESIAGAIDYFNSNDRQAKRSLYIPDFTLKTIDKVVILKLRGNQLINFLSIKRKKSHTNLVYSNTNLSRGESSTSLYHPKIYELNTDFLTVPPTHI